MATLSSKRLRYRPLAQDQLDEFHALVIDSHIRRYMLDGAVMERSWSNQNLIASQALFTDREVGLWLIYPNDEPLDEAIGFAGFHVLKEPNPEPQLVYALVEAQTGQGYATEVGRALIEEVTARGWQEVVTAVDAPNTASIRVLRKLGFAQSFSFPGAFGRQFYFRKYLRQPLPVDPSLRNLLATAKVDANEEIFETLIAREGVRIERIVSTGQRTADETWYEQDEHEWLILLQGAARLVYSDGQVVALEVGDSLLVPAGRKHRVQWTEPGTTTVWLAVFFR